MTFVHVDNDVSDESAESCASQDVGSPMFIAVEASVADHAGHGIGGDFDPNGVIMFGDNGRKGEGLGGVTGGKGVVAAERVKVIGSDIGVRAAATDGVFDGIENEAGGD